MTRAATAEAERFVQEALEFLNAVKSGDWVPPGLSIGGGLAALDATMRPIDELARNGLDWLTPHVQPLQLVLDGLAGRASVIEQFADHWQRTAARVEELRDQYQRRVAGETESWRGAAGDAYRRHAQQMTFALQAAAHVANAQSILTRQIGELIADARRKVNDLLTDLVQRLITYARQAIAVERGVTPNVLAQCTAMINSYRGPIAEIEKKLEQAQDAIQVPQLEAPPAPAGPSAGERLLDIVSIVSGLPGKAIGMVARAWRNVRALFGRRGRREPREVTQEEMIRAIRESPRTRIGQVEGPTTNIPPGQHPGYVMQSRVDRVVRERYPDVQFDSARRGATGPDMRVTGSRRDPGFDWIEIKPDSESGIREFVSREWGRTPEWTGRGRLVTYDNAGNIYEINFPATTRPH